MTTYYVKLSNDPNTLLPFTTYAVEGGGEAANIELYGEDAQGNKVPLGDAVSFDEATSTYTIDTDKVSDAAVEYKLGVIPPDHQ
jgi:hypothetical protein